MCIRDRCGLCRDNGLQVGEFVRGVMAGTGSLAKFLPAVIYIVACFIGFATGTSWGTIGIMVPLVCAVFDWYDPVSYTHLDVYKRQVRRLRCPDGEHPLGL